jgi:Protein of unknown function (DUF2752)
MRRIPLLALGSLLAGCAAWLAASLQPVLNLLPGCAFKHLTGFACATCGMTRSLVALGRWDWREAFHWYPAMAILAALLPALALWDLHRAWRGDPYPRLPDSKAARVAIWLILLGVWALQVARGI